MTEIGKSAKHSQAGLASGLGHKGPWSQCQTRDLPLWSGQPYVTQLSHLKQLP